MNGTLLGQKPEEVLTCLNSSISMNGTLLGHIALHTHIESHSSISMNGTLLGRAMTVGAAAILASQQMALHKDFALSNGYNHRTTL